MAVEGPLGPAGRGGLSIDQARYRTVLGHFATGVTVVTAISGDRPVGLSVNSFTSISLDPPLVGFCVARTSSTWPVIRATRSFCVNVLAEEQEHLSRAFAAHSADKFSGVGWEPGPSGAPVLAGSLAWIDCELENEHDGGDHIIVIGRVRSLEVVSDARPLLFYRGGYGHFEP